ncbi:MAG: DUF2225 domain-containing protein [Spirochaetaceae bacterium]|jgi:uncharacterized protein (DUF2225 family)|nr:DUF2225 domain-containing protein [Spirochaetaceae bacterium]
MAKKSDDDSLLKVSFLSKNSTRCPVCGETFRREELLSGSGRLIAGVLTDELHRLYETSRYGDLYPLAYSATVCPRCWFAAMDQDFIKLPKDRFEQAQAAENSRKKSVQMIFADIDFYESRNLTSGAASQFLVCLCYDCFPAEFSPTVKQGLAALRAGWLFEHMHSTYPGQHYDWLSELFKKKACFFYAEALQRETTGKETLSGLTAFGPDTDKNYGYEGMLYLRGVLEYKYGSQKDPRQRYEALSDSKRNIAKIFGLGKSSKSKPGPLLEHGKELYTILGKELQDFDE